ncbi:Calcineurin-like phosphoesterase [Rubripirellula lacrimiformis]|uniref:Calcineurin-like phosphoesterase n=1 Tax=Rubripirellula lacrimiformis TaxID=1930273 RepID=A0A517ND22_9BACT|nr:metallophosphoesterase [Rubripirellula lacrimiformis]QDT05037.1 Calcineurin-like phosphoesterase [Rubripirellula lacrimiformis]
MNRFVFQLLLACCATAALADDATFTAAPAGSFTIAVIPDTQSYVKQTSASDSDGDAVLRNPIFETITDWIATNRQQQNIVFVSHVGDIVDKNVPEQWNVARQCMDRIHGVIPYGVTVGNHDMVTAGDSSLFQKYFPESRFKDFDWYGGSFHPDRPDPAISGNNANSYQKIRTPHLNLLHLNLECNAPDDVLAWANKTIASHPKHHVIITTHMDLGPTHRPTTNQGYIIDPKGRMEWKKCHSRRGNTAVEMWDKCFKLHENVFLICSGDQRRSQAMHVTAHGDHGNVVHSCLSDYSSDGSLRLYRFVPDEDRVDVITYNADREQLTRTTQLVADHEEHQFSFEHSMPSP